MAGRNLESAAGAGSSWTAAELAEIRTRLEGDIAVFRRELAMTEGGLVDQLRETATYSGDEAGDVGAFRSEVGTETALVNNTRAILVQSLRALERLATSQYGTCESCESWIGKPRLRVFPRATLCLRCQGDHRHR